MNQSVPLYVFALVVGAIPAIALLYWAIGFVQNVRSKVDALKESIDAQVISLRLVNDTFNRACDVAGPAAVELRLHMSAVPKLLEAVAKVGEAQLIVTKAARAERMQKDANPFGKTNAPRLAPDINQANLEYEVTQMMRYEGLSREEALLRLNPANAGTVWDGNKVFDGWGTR